MEKKKLSGLLVYFWMSIASLVYAVAVQLIQDAQTETWASVVSVIISVIAVGALVHAAREYKEFAKARNYSIATLVIGASIIVAAMVMAAMAGSNPNIAENLGWFVVASTVFMLVGLVLGFMTNIALLTGISGVAQRYTLEELSVRAVSIRGQMVKAVLLVIVALVCTLCPTPIVGGISAIVALIGLVWVIVLQFRSLSCIIKLHSEVNLRETV